MGMGKPMAIAYRYVTSEAERDREARPASGADAEKMQQAAARRNARTTLWPLLGDQSSSRDMGDPWIGEASCSLPPIT